MDRFLLIFENLTFSDSSWHLAFTPSSAQIVPVSLVAGRHGRQSPFAPGALHLIPGSFIHRFVALVVLQKPANFQSQRNKRQCWAVAKWRPSSTQSHIDFVTIKIITFSRIIRHCSVDLFSYAYKWTFTFHLQDIGNLISEREHRPSRNAHFWCLPQVSRGDNGRQISHWLMSTTFNYVSCSTFKSNVKGSGMLLFLLAT